MILFVCLIAFSSALTACAEQEPVPCRDILSALTNAEIGLPAGKIYHLSDAEGEDGFLSEKLINSLYGDGDTPPMREGWLDISLFLPTSLHPCEFAVFLCDSTDTATDTARLLLRRLDVIRTVKADSQYTRLLDSATVTIKGNYVFLIISSDIKSAVKLASKLVN